jgi:hypothetical protein
MAFISNHFRECANVDAPYETAEKKAVKDDALKRVQYL